MNGRAKIKPKNLANTLRLDSVSGFTTYSCVSGLSFSSTVDKLSVSNVESFISTSSLVIMIFNCSMNVTLCSAAMMKSLKNVWLPGNWKFVLKWLGATKRWLNLLSFDGSTFGKSSEASWKPKKKTEINLVSLAARIPMSGETKRFLHWNCTIKSTVMWIVSPCAPYLSDGPLNSAANELCDRAPVQSPTSDSSASTPTIYSRTSGKWNESGTMRWGRLACGVNW